MQSITHIYKTGHGPSSSHTMGPFRAATIFRTRFPDADEYKVTLYGSLAATGKGHLTDHALQKAFSPKTVTIEWLPDEQLPAHPNGMGLVAREANGTVLGTWTVYSIGGGELMADGLAAEKEASVYTRTTMQDILASLQESGQSCWEFVHEHEADGYREYLADVWRTMQAAVSRGLENEGVLPGGLKLARKAGSYYARSRSADGFIRQISTAFAYALAVAEENASGSIIVTAPTCGSAGVVPAVLRVLRETYDIPDKKIINALATAGLFGTVIAHNASIAGAEVGCQGEVGTACAMAAAAAAQLLGGSPVQIEYAAEMGIEHHLGLTCDPIGGLVQIPCIERNAMAAVRALECATYALMSDGRHIVSFDAVVRTMKETGQDLNARYRETAWGGLAKLYRDKME